jgi:hypothetical protein
VAEIRLILQIGARIGQRRAPRPIERLAGDDQLARRIEIV